MEEKYNTFHFHPQFIIQLLVFSLNICWNNFFNAIFQAISELVNTDTNIYIFLFLFVSGVLNRCTIHEDNKMKNIHVYW